MAVDMRRVKDRFRGIDANPVAWIVTIGFLVFGLCILWNSFYTVESGERGVLLRFGDMVAVEEPGLHMKWPFIEKVVPMSVRSHNYQIKTGVYSADTQAADVELSVNYQLEPADVGRVYVTYGRDYARRIIAPQIQSQCKDAFGTFTAMNIVRSRDAVAQKIYENLIGNLTKYGILVTSVQIENLDFSDEYEKSVEERMKAEVDVDKFEQSKKQRLIQADMVRIEAQAAADARIMQAKSEAESIRLKGEAEAAAISMKAKALAAAGNDYVELVKADRWDGKLPTTMIPNQSMPIIK